MKKTELIKRLTAMKICTECQIMGKPCDDNCKWQYEVGNMGEIVHTLKEAIMRIEQDRKWAYIKMDIINMSEDLDYDSGDYDVDMENEAKREACREILSLINKRLESEDK